MKMQNAESSSQNSGGESTPHFALCLQAVGGIFVVRYGRLAMAVPIQLK